VSQEFEGSLNIVCPVSRYFKFILALVKFSETMNCILITPF